MHDVWYGEIPNMLCKLLVSLGTHKQQGIQYSCLVRHSVRGHMLITRGLALLANKNLGQILAHTFDHGTPDFVVFCRQLVNDHSEQNNFTANFQKLKLLIMSIYNIGIKVDFSCANSFGLYSFWVKMW